MLRTPTGGILLLNNPVLLDNSSTKGCAFKYFKYFLGLGLIIVIDIEQEKSGSIESQA